MRHNLEANVTLRDLVGKLNDPVAFIRGVIGVMHETKKEHGDVVVRLGLTGTGKLPNYRLDSAVTGQPIQAFDGNGHGAWKGEEDFTAPTNWSTEAMTRTEVEDVLAELTGFKRKGSPSNA